MSRNGTAQSLAVEVLSTTSTLRRSVRGELGKVHALFGDRLSDILKDLNGILSQPSVTHRAILLRT